MNLIKLFNGKYLKQNLKKSKGLLTILVLIVPIISTLVFILQNSYGYAIAIDQRALSIINVFGMYSIPFIISIILNGYIYRRNSVDFINSMPMSRKTIYFTNFVGGVIIIVAIQVLTLITNLICATMLHNLFIPIAMIFDIFTVMLISYIFVYSVCLLAQTVSGNELTQLVVVALILFLIPFMHYIFTVQGMTANRIWEISFEGGSTHIDECMQSNYTMPFNIMLEILFYNSTFYNQVSMVKMFVLTIVYLILGLIMFEKRKMENLGTSFNTLKTHYIVKGLTLIPVVFICESVKTSNVGIAIAIGIMAIYYSLYDFVVSKKVKLHYTVICFVVTVAGLFGLYNAGNYLVDNLKINTISINDIVSISACKENFNDNSVLYNKTLDIEIEDKELIKEVMEKSFGRDWYFTSRTEYEFLDAVKEDDLSQYSYLLMKIKLKNGREIYSRTFIENDVYEKFVKLMEEQPGYADSFKFKEAVVYDNKILSKEDTATIKEILESKCFDIEYMGYLGLKLSYSAYDNHTAREMTVDIGINQEVFDIATRNYNQEAMEILKDLKEINGGMNYHISKYIPNDRGNLDRDDISIEINENIKEYMEKHCNDVCDVNKDIYVIRIYGLRSLTFITNVNPEIDAIIEESGEMWQSQMREFYEKEDAEIYYN